MHRPACRPRRRLRPLLRPSRRRRSAPPSSVGTSPITVSGVGVASSLPPQAARTTRAPRARTSATTRAMEAEAYPRSGRCIRSPRRAGFGRGVVDDERDRDRAAKESGAARSSSGSPLWSVRATSRAKTATNASTARPTHQEEVARAHESSIRSTRSPPSPTGPSSSAFVTWLDPPVAASSPISAEGEGQRGPTTSASARRPRRRAARRERRTRRRARSPRRRPRRSGCRRSSRRSRSAVPANAAQPSRAKSRAAPARAGREASSPAGSRARSSASSGSGRRREGDRRPVDRERDEVGGDDADEERAEGKGRGQEAREKSPRGRP